MAVRCSGIVISSLFYENVKSTGDQMGLLLGQVRRKVSDDISDININAKKEESTTYIYDFLPCNFCEKNCTVLKEKLEQLLDDKAQSIVGWYNFRRNSSPIVTWKENIIHRNLMQKLSWIQNDQVLFMLFLSDTQSDECTPSFDRILMISQKSEFIRVSLSITNLQDTSHNQYKLEPSTLVPEGASGYRDTLKQAEPWFFKKGKEMHQVEGVRRANKDLMKQTQTLLELVIESENKIEEVTREIEELKLEKKRKAKALKEKKEKEQMSIEKTEAMDGTKETSDEPNVVKMELNDVTEEPTMKPDSDNFDTEGNEDSALFTSSPIKNTNSSLEVNTSNETDQCPADANNDLLTSYTEANDTTTFSVSDSDTEAKDTDAEKKDHFLFLSNILDIKTKTPMNKSKLGLRKKSRHAETVVETSSDETLVDETEAHSGTLENEGSGISDKDTTLLEGDRCSSAPSTTY